MKDVVILKLFVNDAVTQELRNKDESISRINSSSPKIITTL